jgi:hypothetical protein
MLQRHRVAVRRADRERPAALRHGACERHDPCSRHPHVGAEVAGDVDSTVLTGCVRIVAEDERAQHLAVDRPGPGIGRRGRDAGGDDQEEDDSAHLGLLVLDIDNIRFGL